MEKFEWCSLLASTPIAGDGGTALNEWSRARDDLRSNGCIAARSYKSHVPAAQRSSGESDSCAVSSSASENRDAIASKDGGDNCGSGEVDQKAEPCGEVAVPGNVYNTLRSPRVVFVGGSDSDESGLAYSAGGSSGLPLRGAAAAILRSFPQLSDLLRAADPSMLNEVLELLNPEQQQQQQQPSGRGDVDAAGNGIGEAPPSIGLARLVPRGAVDAYSLSVLPDQGPGPVRRGGQDCPVVAAMAMATVGGRCESLPSTPPRLSALNSPCTSRGASPMITPANCSPLRSPVLSTSAETAAAHATLPPCNVGSSGFGSVGNSGKGSGPSPLSRAGRPAPGPAPEVAGSSPTSLPLGLSWSMASQSGEKVVCQQQQQEQQRRQRKRTWEEATYMRTTADAATIAAVAAVAAATDIGRDEHCSQGSKPKRVNNDRECDEELNWQPRTMRKTLWNGKGDGHGSSERVREDSGSGSGSGYKIKAKSMTERQRRDRISDALTRLRVAVDGHGDMASMLNHAVNTLHTLQQTNKQLELQLLQHRLLCSCGAGNTPVHCQHLSG